METFRETVADAMDDLPKNSRAIDTPIRICSYRAMRLLWLEVCAVFF
jgi:hypothetical protein